MKTLSLARTPTTAKTLQRFHSLKCWIFPNLWYNKGRDTVNGRLDFLQLVGITEKELQTIKGKNREERERFVKVMQQDNPDLITDMAREKEYLDF
ncbi:suppressor of fused domain protein [Brevibacillus invocatus]|uniref:suppressor of fused domain protein n=1 Tax=Brevibacillus invocatus TaxID=173959 RepID=UPI0023EA6F66|nr:suppressor of fused domain protein [Brevibacillus invocatus]